MRILWLADALRAEGLKVVEVDGWRSRGFDMLVEPLRGALFHHTVTPIRDSNGNPVPDSTPLRTVTFGRSDLPGPIANAMVGRDLRAYVIASGKANHAGEGGPWKDVPQDDGNRHTFGLEVVNNGTTEEWSEQMLDVVTAVFAAVLKHEGLDASRCIGHKEWAPGRKVDPHSLSMDRYRERVQTYMDGGGEEQMLEDYTNGEAAYRTKFKELGHDPGSAPEGKPKFFRKGWASARFAATNPKGGADGPGTHTHNVAVQGTVALEGKAV